jgi:hypothetical protein
VAQPQLRSSRSILVLAIAVWAACAAGELPTKAADLEIPDDVANVLPWLPADTETLIVARDIALRSPFRARQSEKAEPTDEERRRLGQFAMVWLTKAIALGRLPLLGGGDMLRTGRFIDVFGDAALPLAVYGGRDYEVVSNFGTYRWHGCSVLVFPEEKAESVERFMQVVRDDAPGRRKMQGHEVFVFSADKGEMESRHKLEKWQGTYLVRVQPNVLLCATSDIYLSEVLDRIALRPADRLLPADLPEWKYVDPSSSVWGLRRIPPIKEQNLAGVVWQAQAGGRQIFEAYYLPGPSGDVERPAQAWFIEIGKDGERIMPIELQEQIQQLPDGTTKIYFDLDQVGRGVSFPLFQLYHLQGYPGTWNSARP